MQSVNALTEELRDIGFSGQSEGEVSQIAAQDKGA
jgi:hypothetical protein